MARKSLSPSEKAFRQLSNVTINTAINIIAAQKVNFISLKKPGNSSKGRQQRDSDNIQQNAVDLYRESVNEYVNTYGRYDLKECIAASIHQNPLIGKPRASLLQLIEDQCRTLRNSVGFAESEYKQALLVQLEGVIVHIESNYLSEKGKARRQIEVFQQQLKELRKQKLDTKEVEQKIKEVMKSHQFEGYHEPYTDYFVDFNEVISYIESTRIKQIMCALNKFIFNKQKFEIQLLDIDYKKRMILNVINDIDMLDKAA